MTGVELFAKRVKYLSFSVWLCAEVISGSGVIPVKHHTLLGRWYMHYCSAQKPFFLRRTFSRKLV